VTREAPARSAPVGWPRPSVTVVAMAPIGTALGGPPALVLGYARLPEHHLTDAGRLLAHAVHAAEARAATSKGRGCRSAP